MYNVYQMVIEDKELISTFEEWSFICHSLYNEALFVLRNLYTGLVKSETEITDNEKEVVANINKTIKKYQRNDVINQTNRTPSYELLVCYLSKFIESENYFSSIPRHTAQHIIRTAREDFKNWKEALKAYNKDSSKFTGRPKMPKYKKDSSSFKFSNQEAKFYKQKFGYELKLPRLKKRLNVSFDLTNKRLKEVTVNKYYDKFKLNFVLEDKKYEVPAIKTNTKASIDFGVDNIIAMSTNKGDSLLIKGGVIKSKNQWYNKLLAKNHRGQTIGTKEKVKSSKALNKIYENRNNFMKDYMHKISKEVVNWCVFNNVSTLVLGKNNLWKQNINIGKKNNQNFVQIPLNILLNYIVYKANRVGIETIIQEESYTSKASFLDNDTIPVYEEGKTYKFSGKRTKRGLYKSKEGIIINADLNGALNILRKAFPQESFYLKKYRLPSKTRNLKNSLKVFQRWIGVQ